MLGIAAHPVTRARPFPGGAIAGFDDFLLRMRAAFPFLGEAQSERMAHAYGSCLIELLEGATDAADMGEDLGGGLTAREVRWMRDREWARTPEDVLWRRSKLGLELGDDPALLERIAAVIRS